MSISTNLCFYKESAEGTSTCDEITIDLKDPIVLDTNKQYAIGIRYFSFKNAFLNISAAFGNNKFYYHSGSSAADRTITIPDGVYSYADFNAVLEKEQTANTDYTVDTNGNTIYDVVLGINSARMRFEFILQTSSTIDFTQADTPRSILGYASAVYSDAYSTAPNIPNIQTVTTIYLHSNLIHGTYYSTNSDSKVIKSDIYSSYFVTNAPSAYKIYDSSNIRYVPIRPTQNLYEIRFWITDAENVRVSGLTNKEFHFKLDFEIIEILKK
jgi:hypothetical protein